MEKGTKTWLIVGLSVLILAAVITIASLSSSSAEGDFLSVKGFDINGRQRLSVVNGVENVAFISLVATLTNTDSVPLTIEITSITPAEFSPALPANQLTLQPGETGSLETELIDIQQFEGMTKDFCLTAESLAIEGSREASSLSACASVTIEANPSGSFTLTVDADPDDSGINPGCIEDWSCTAWSQCVSGFQTRTCVDDNACGTTSSKPSEEQTCETSGFQTNAVNGNYNQPGVWIEFNGLRYDRGGYSSFDCASQGGTILFYEPQKNYPVCSRNGYAVTDRVYLDNGLQGIIFETN